MEDHQAIKLNETLIESLGNLNNTINENLGQMNINLEIMGEYLEKIFKEIKDKGSK